ncbi:MAG: HD domain-containing protein [Treponema sp.]|nr:HD domain-containing protein [Treponema sp.]
MATIPLPQVVDNSVYSKDVKLDEQFLLLCEHMTFTPALKKALADWDFREIITEGTVEERKAAEPKPQKQTAVSADSAAKKSTPVKESDFEEISLDELGASEDNDDSPSGQTRSRIAAIRAEGTSLSRMELVRKIYNEYTNYILQLYTHYATHKILQLEEISSITEDLCQFIKENKRYVLRVTPSITDSSKNFLISHSMRSTVIAIAIGLQLHMPKDKLTELGVASILHEIGQIRLPPQLYMTNRTLSGAEKQKMQAHPILSYNILKENDFPLAICLATLEHHERENGSGYPQRLPSHKITVYAKIISVACSFEAITTPRDYKEEKTTFAAMVEMLKNADHQYDETVIKALLHSLSLFPIGSYVYLANGKVGQVIDVLPQQPLNPIVQLMNEKEADGTRKTVQSDNAQNKIVRVLNKQEAEDLFITLQLDSDS